MPPILDRDSAAAFARIALGHVTREYPHKLDHVMTDPADIGTPRALHPLFYGSLDWHSCVHGYWTLARVLREAPDMAHADAIRSLFQAQFVPAKVAAECAYFAQPSARGFERPYGWAWLLKLAEELRHHAPAPWASALDPLATLIAAQFRQFLPRATYPIRAGTHGNTAFALALAADYARAVEDEALLALLRETAWRWYGEDRDCQAWEPGGDDFLSPALIEAECMRRLFAADVFAGWFGGFLPRLERDEPATLFTPATVTDRSDGKLAHLDGLNLSRAWCWQALAGTFAPTDARRAKAERAATAHRAAALPHIAGDYMGEHWLASFALLALGA